MNKINLFLIIIFLVLVLTENVWAKEIYYGSSPETVKLVYGQSTIFRFYKQVRTISQVNRFEILPADANDPDYSVLSVNPKFTTGMSNAVFILSDGTSINLKLVMASKGSQVAEAMYDFKPKNLLLENGEENSKLPVVTEIELLKAMIRDDEVVGYKRTKINKGINSHFKGVSVTLDYVYSGKEYNGYVFLVVNDRKSSDITVDVKKITIGSPNMAVMAQIDQEVIRGDKKESLLRVVAKSSANYEEILFPISLVTKENGNGTKSEAKNEK